ncbi:MAG: nucleotidyltransferase domain-containing protein [Flavobacteriales bacterium]|nr:nucleotidyltransferase domain-containing protein [Flavobacteriales bacterium]
MDLEFIRKNNLILLECVSGSTAYGLATPQSDTDIKGVFVQPKETYYGLGYVPQISDEKNDVVFYELKRFIELLSVNNPNILELLNTPEEHIIFKSPLLHLINPKSVLSKKCKDTFGGFALSQIKKAQGLKKKIVNPLDREKKDLLAFCYVLEGDKSVALIDFLDARGWKQEECGLSKIPLMKGMYHLYHNIHQQYSGVISSAKANEVSLSSIPKDVQADTVLYLNKDGYSSYCKEYREYWAWVENRNEERFLNNQKHNRNYDSKNMMHVFRLLEMALEIAKEGKINVARPNREFLLSIKSGDFTYDELLSKANGLFEEMEQSFEVSDLPQEPDVKLLDRLAFEIREGFYHG